MSWLALLGIAVVFTTIAALIGGQPDGARPVSGTRMMGAARVILFILGAIFLILAVRGYFAG